MMIRRNPNATESRSIISITIDPASVLVFDKLTKKYDTSRSDFIERVVLDFARREKVVQPGTPQSTLKWRMERHELPPE